MKLLVTGGAGYIGGFMTERLLNAKHDVIVLDSLERGHKESVDVRAKLIVGNILDAQLLNSLFKDHKIDAIFHFAGYISMAESMENPQIYFNNNSFSTLKLLEMAKKYSINKFIFSSTAGVYGNPTTIPIPESHPGNPENPYGESKLISEKLLKWFQKIYGINFIALRYFNACGAALDGSRGENHSPETHIIPKAIEAAISRTPFILYGDDYKTKDGSCVRDYIHVLDLIEAHVLALEKLSESSGGFYNVGTGNGFSNKEIIEGVRQVSGIDFQTKMAPRRPGDADELIADSSKIVKDLKFKPKFSDLKTIISSAWKWHSKKYENSN
jgi:UDP-glucose 4-epimerase